jgi:hypothetical protein
MRFEDANDVPDGLWNDAYRSHLMLRPEANAPC